jgi:hypothetical protein
MKINDDIPYYVLTVPGIQQVPDRIYSASYPLYTFI